MDSNIPPPPSNKKVRDSDEAIERLWLIIDEATKMVKDEEEILTANERKAWAAVLGNTIAILNKVLASQKVGERKIDKDKIARIVSSLPKRYVKIVEKKSRLRLFDE